MKKAFILCSLLIVNALIVMLVVNSAFAAESIKILSDNSWKSYDSLQAGWESPGFDDSGWRNAYAPYPYNTVHPPTHYIPDTNAVYMWDYPDYPPTVPDGRNGPDEAWFRKTFTVPCYPSNVVSASAVVGADDDFDFYVNGILVHSDWDDTTSTAPFTIDIKPYLVKGENVFAMYAKDSVGGWEWALVDATIFKGPYFSNVTSDVGLTDVIGNRISIADVNGDGYPDLLLHKPVDPRGANPDVLDKQFLYLNVKGDNPNDPHSRKYIDYTEQSGIRANRQGTNEGRHSSAAIFADVDNDGDPDMFTSVYLHDNFSLNKGTNELLLNDGSGHFMLAPNSPFHNEPIYNTTSATFLDYDNDGNIDLFIGNFYYPEWWMLSQDQLYRGNGDGSFTNVTNSTEINGASTCVYAVAAADWNGDGYVDLFAPSYSNSVPGSIPVLWKNNGDGTFSQVQETANYDQYRGYGSRIASFGTMPRDFDNDGDIDFLEILVQHGEVYDPRYIYSTVVVNESNIFSWDFYRVVGRADDDPCPTHHGDHYGSWFDIENDGLADFALTESGYASSCGGVANDRVYLFRQSEDNTFHVITSEAGLDSINASNLSPHNISPFDYDLDGDEDLLIGFNGEDSIQLWRNDAGALSNNWITISLVGGGIHGRSNRSAIGARVEVTAGSKTYTREVYAGNGHQGPQVPLSLTFGLGQATNVDTIKVYWQNENHTLYEISNVADNQFIHIYEIGDLDLDFDVDYHDYLVFRTAYGSCEGDANFLPAADLDGDGCVTINDYRILRTLI
jgi:hypothetical protein